jgi:enamine deaminase RidA (YjgF/YER057c/UK114 family)
MNTRQNIGVARQIGSYSDGVEVPSGKRWLVTSGTPGLGLDGTLPADITGQAELAWTHIRTMLEQAQMTVDDIVKVTQYLLSTDDIKPYAAVRSRFLGGARPASMLLVVPALVWPNILLEVEIVAAA